MRNRLVVAGLILGMFIACSANAYTNAYVQIPAQSFTTSQMDLNPMLLNNMSSPQSSNTQAQTTKQSQTQNTAPAKTTQTKSQTSPAKNLSEKDLQLEGSVEKTQQTSLYHGQSAAELQDLVMSIGRKIINSNNIQNSIHFQYVDKETVNANVNGSNMVTVYRGLIQNCETEDELAYIIGHEIGHATNYHIIKGTAVSKVRGFAQSQALGALAAATGNQFVLTGATIAANTLGDMGEKKYSRVQETDADLASIDYIVQAGYNPLGAVTITGKIGVSYFDLLSDHPSTDKRVLKMYNYVKEKYPKYIEQGYDSETYKKILEYYVVKK